PLPGPMYRSRRHNAAPPNAQAMTCLASGEIQKGGAIMKKLLWGLFAASSVSLGIVGTAAAQPSEVQVQGVSHSGTGCPAGSVDTVVSGGKDSVILGFDAFVA